MGAQKTFTVQVLPKEEAWNLFREVAGISEEDTNFLSTKMAVVNECRGLPIAILTVGRALYGKDETSWQYSDIPKEAIVRYGIGLELFGSIDSVGEARDIVHVHIDHLKKCFLLMDGRSDGFVQMHDVIRDLAISIASREEHSFMVKALKRWPENERRGDYVVISMICTGMHVTLPHNLEFPKLQLLRLESKWEFPIESPESFYQGMKELKVVDLSSMYIQPLSTSLQCSTNLQVLSLLDCELVDKDLAVIKALKNLEILSFTGSNVEELPREIGNLNCLKLLDLLNCKVRRIPYGVLSSLSKLEGLYLGVSFAGWDVVEDGKDMTLTNACIAELASLPNLVALDIYVPNVECWVWPRDVVFLGNIRAFHICFGKSSRYIDECLYPPTNRLALNRLGISRGVMEILELKLLLKITRILRLSSIKWVKHNIRDLDENGFRHLLELQVARCLDLECLINTSDGQLAKEAFCVLKTLHLSVLPELRHLWKGPTQLACLRSLTDVTVYRCPTLERCVFSLAIARNLVQLQNITIQECDQLDVIVSSIEGVEHEIVSAAAEENEIQFPRLALLVLNSLPNFTGFCKPMMAVKLPQLKHLELEDIPKINCLWPASENNYGTIIQPLFNNKVDMLLL
ncbi:hypothetical protein Vadar_034018 [Vaccinium darrowii]|uniref:Uncharacterized protein n=1 Tax=Vaccinium darrowii TaxID=229202 RepID=A0ACB7Y3U6_9ERIC|nr:hypothetical protein Vadar_034018 [Vaccinium darrowii]